MAASSKPLGLMYALVFFMMLSIVLGVTTYMFNRDYSEAVKKEETAKAELQKVNAALKTLVDDLQAVKKLLGREEYELVVNQQNPDDTNTLVGALKRDMRDQGGPLAEATYSATLAKLRATINTLTAERDSKTASFTSTEKDMLALEGRYRQQSDDHQKARRTAEASMRQVVSDRDEQINSKNQEISKVRSEKADVEVALEQEKDARLKERKQMADENAKLIAINDKLIEELKDLKKESFEVADGKIDRVDNTSRMVWINLGNADFLKPKMTFSVYGKDTPGVGRSTADIKGKVEVTRVIGPHLSEAKMVEEDLYRPMAPNDLVYTPLWSPGRTEKFAVVGIVDMDGDGKSDRDLFRAELAVRGAVLASEVDDDGNRSPDGATIDESVKYMVLGKIPDINNLDNQDDRPKVQAIMDHLKDMRKEARLHGVQIISFSDFLNFIGYKPKQRIFRPGEDRPFTLKAGAASAGVNDAIGDRTSSGAVSGAFSRKSTLPPQTSTGTTSRIFGSGGR